MIFSNPEAVSYNLRSQIDFTRPRNVNSEHFGISSLRMAAKIWGMVPDGTMVH